MKLQKKDSVAIHFFGTGLEPGRLHDPSISPGHEAAVVYVCDNNCYAMSVPPPVQAMRHRHPAAGYDSRVVVDGTISWVYRHAAGNQSGSKRRWADADRMQDLRWLGHNFNDPNCIARLKRRSWNKNAR